ncbi:MAG: hypothetical protein ACTHU7_12090 [Microbacterium sp.]
MVPALVGTASVAIGNDQRLYDTRPPRREGTRVRMIPYYSWNNRGQSTMQVWLREG